MLCVLDFRLTTYCTSQDIGGMGFFSPRLLLDIKRGGTDEPQLGFLQLCPLILHMAAESTE